MDQLPGVKPATRDFFARDSLEVGPALLGAILQRTDARGTVAIRLTEVEAYGCLVRAGEVIAGSGLARERRDEPSVSAYRAALTRTRPPAAG